MSARRRKLSESSDPDDPEPAPAGGLGFTGFTATKRARLSQEESQSTEDDGELEGQAGGLDKALDSSSSDTEPGQVEAARLDKPGQYSSAAERMMAKMGYKSGSGLGKAGQGRVEPVGLSRQRGRRGLGLILKGLETDDTIEWNEENERIVVEEKVNWMEAHSLPVPPLEELRGWCIEGQRKEDISDEHNYCDQDALVSVLSAKTVFDKLEGDELLKARTRSNPFETIRGAFFLNRAAMKMANLDAICDYMFTNPTSDNGNSLVGRDEPLYFADVCAGPGGFSEYVLWRKKWRSKGFGFTLRNAGHDFKMDDFYAGPPESFEPHYGVNGADGDGNVFNSDNIREFRKFVMENTGGKGVHFMMADGGFSVEGQENIQEILSKQLYLCQFLVALSIVRPQGHFVCKLFDLFTPFSVGLIYLMYRSFQAISIHKPNTSRPANSERYIICKWKRPDSDNIRHYMLEINERINQLGFSLEGNTRSEVDILNIVPDSVMMRDSPGFLEYMKESNNDIADSQIVGLTKIAAFCKNQNLHEFRQGEIRTQSLHFWKVPDESRRKPMMEKPPDAANRILQQQAKILCSHDHLLLGGAFEALNVHIKSAYDWRAVVLGAPKETATSDRSFILGLGRSKVYLLDPASNFWRRLEDLVRFELSPDTLLYGEIVTEYRGEGKSQRKVKAVQIIDGFRLGGEDISNKHFMERHELTKLFLNNMNRASRNDYVKLKMKNVFKLEDLGPLYNTCSLKMLKGSSCSPRLVHELPELEADGLPRYFQPSGLMLIKTVREPFMMAVSKSQQRKYWYNAVTRESKFEMPCESVARFSDSVASRLVWYWDQGGGVHPHLPPPPKGSVSRADMDMFDKYEVVSRLKANDKIPVTKYRSARTGLTVTVAQVDGPVVNGYFCLATEAHDDDGLPHTLEHLVFMGSELYPYKGVLDLLANRCLSSGTNAWTDTDHTCYTMTTAGSQGFLNLLPIYLDHILYPTLTPEGYITEVHHVTEEGKDAGVVYCEMQGRENSGESRVHLAMLREMYPGHCGYKSETGGIMKNLRESTSHQKVVDYHRQFYRPENLGLVITGQVGEEEVMAALDTMEERILAKGERQPFLRPWSGSVPRLEVGKEITVNYPADEEDNGLVYAAWRGPSAVTALYRMFATMVLMEYLTETSVSPLQARFVEIESPLASRVGYSFIENMESTVFLTFRNVPKEKIPLVGAELKNVLTELVEGKIPWDRARMETVINRRISEQMSQIENSPHDAVAFMVIGDMLYGNTTEDLRVRLNSVQEFEKMKVEPESFWLDLIDNILVKGNRILVMGIPSIKLQEEMRKEEEERIQKQKEALGEEGLKKKGEILDNAMEKNEEEAPEEMLSSVPIPDGSSIKFHPVTSYKTTDSHQLENFDLKKMPVSFQFDQISSNFVYLTVVIDTSVVPLKLKPYIPLFLEMVLESPVLEGETEIPYEEVVAKLSEDTVEHSFSLGIGGRRFMPGAFSQSAVLSIQAEPAKYETAVGWIRKLLFQTKLTAERAKVLGTKMENSVSEMKRSGNHVVKIMMNSMMFQEESNHQAANMIRQQAFLKNLRARLDCSPNEVLGQLEEIRFHLSSPGNMMVHMAADLATLGQDPMSAWLTFLPPHVPKAVSPALVTAEHSLALAPPAHLLAGLGSCESSFLSRTAPSLSSPRSPDLAPLMLAIQYLTQLEGPMWRQIRGAGLAYGYSIMVSTNKGQIYFTLFKATNPVKAYEEGKRLVMSQVNGTEPWDPLQVEAAKSSLIFELIEREKTVGEVAQESLLSSMKGIDREFNRKFLEMVNNVSLEDLQRVGTQYLAPLFSEKTRTSIVCNPSKVEEIKADFQALGVEFKVLESVDQLAQL